MDGYVVRDRDIYIRYKYIQYCVFVREMLTKNNNAQAIHQRILT